jgi:hypothetical protein
MVNPALMQRRALLRSAKSWSKAFESIRTKQIPFATAVALTKTARDANLAVRASLEKRFTIRRKGLEKGWRSTRANKKDWPRIEAGVGSKEGFWKLHEYGGTKKPENASKMAVPTRATKRGKSGRITPSNRPKALIQKGKAIVTPTAILRAKAKKKDRRRIVYLRFKSVRVKKRLGARETILNETRRVFAGHLERELAAAIKSARVRAGSFSSSQGRAAYVKARSRT